MKHTILRCTTIFFALICCSASYAQIGSFNNTADSVMFHYRSGSTILYEDYKTNNIALTKLHRMVSANRPAILAGNAHIELFGYILSSQVGNNRAINNASIQASVVRSYLKTQYGLPHSACSFAIDTTQGLQNVVQLQLISGAVPQYSNREISYSESSSAWDINRAVAGYQNGVPYTSYLMVLAKRYNYFDQSGGSLYSLQNERWQADDWKNFADSTSISMVAKAGGLELYTRGADGAYIAASPMEIDSQTSILFTKAPTGEYIMVTTAQVLTLAKNADAIYSIMPQGVLGSSTQSQGFVRNEPYAQAKSKDGAGYRDYPIFGIKTNGLYWLAALPNLELEFYFGKAFSLNIEGSYTWLSQYLKEENAYYVWGVSGEFRYWFNANKRFEHWYMGLYGHTGQYDFKFGERGNQGDYYGAGLSAGYVLPITKHFNIEFGLAVGYVKYVNGAYQWNETRLVNEWVNPNKPHEDRWGIFPTKAKVSFLWKF